MALPEAASLGAPAGLNKNTRELAHVVEFDEVVGYARFTHY
jgi:hypothetical protein